MSTEDFAQDAPPPNVQIPTGPAAMTTSNKKRPKLDLNVEGARERKRGKSMFGILLGTLNKAKIEDKERNASEAVCNVLVFVQEENSQVQTLGEKTAID
jgi:hypothetical protein